MFFFNDQRGASTAEIGLVIGFILLATYAAISTTGSEINRALDVTSNEVEKVSLQHPIIKDEDNTPPTAPPDGADATPDQFTFTDETELAPNSIRVTSFGLTGFDTNIQASIAGGDAEFSVNGGSYVTTATVEPGTFITVKMTSAADFNETVTTTFTAGTVSADWSLTNQTQTPPQWDGSSNLEGTAYALYPLSAPINIPQASDDELDPLTYAYVSGDLKGLTFNAGSLTLTGTPTQNGSISLRLSVSDGHHSVEKTFSFTVNQTPDSCRSVLNTGLGTESGTYLIKPVANISAFSADCDMNYLGGGWTKLIKGTDTELSYLLQFNVLTNNLDGSFSSDEHGVYWGSNDSLTKWQEQNYYNLVLGLNYSDLYIVYSGSYNDPLDGLGKLEIGSSSAPTAALSFLDGHANDVNGQTLIINGTTIYNQALQNEVDRVSTIPFIGSDLSIKMSGFTSDYGYTNRSIKQLWYK